MITGLNVKRAHEPDLIPANMVKLCGEHLCVPLNIIFEIILETGKQVKQANITPVHKKNDKQINSNYRPISILPILAKMFRKDHLKKLI